MSSSNIESETVIIREFAWKPLCVVIISAISDERSTLDISRALVTREPVPSEPGSQRFGSPEFAVAAK